MRREYYNEAWLDDDQKFWDYRTSYVDGQNIFDIKSTGVPDYDYILDNPKRAETQLNKKIKIVQMTPDEYYQICADKVFDIPVDRLKRGRRNDKDVLNHLTDVIQKYNRRFPITYISYAEKGHPEQEGLHRMMVAGDLFGWDHKFPVLIIEWADEELAKKRFDEEHVLKIRSRMQRAVYTALLYNYYNIEELKDQLLSELEDELIYEPEFENNNLSIDLTCNDDICKVILNNKYEYEFDFNEIKLKVSPDQFFDLDDLDDDKFLDDINLNDLEDLF